MMEAYVATDGDIVVRNVEFREVYSVDVFRAERMAQVLRKLRTIQMKDQSCEAGDMLMMLARLVGAKRCCFRPSGDVSRWHNEGVWNYAPVTFGRDMFPVEGA